MASTLHFEARKLAHVGLRIVKAQLQLNLLTRLVHQLRIAMQHAVARDLLIPDLVNLAKVLVTVDFLMLWNHLITVLVSHFLARYDDLLMGLVGHEFLVNFEPVLARDDLRVLLG